MCPDMYRDETYKTLKGVLTFYDKKDGEFYSGIPGAKLPGFSTGANPASGLRKKSN